MGTNMACNRIQLRALILGPTLALVFMSGAHAAQYQVLHNFSDGPSDGSEPYAAGVRFDRAGNLYGTTQGGGADFYGTVFRIAPDGTETVLHSFDGEGGGSFVNAGVTINQLTGDLYGTTNGGGVDEFHGIIWKLTADGTFTVLHSFSGGDGDGSDSRMIRDLAGNLYGSAFVLGGYGKIFTYSVDGKFTVLHSFTQAEGGLAPDASLIRDRAGNLYGVTYTNGGGDHGSVFKLTSDGTSFTTLYRFGGGADGAYPAGGLDRDKEGNLYGTTEQGGGQCSCGTVFKITPRGKHSVLYSFTGGDDGAWPDGDLLRLGNGLYGTTSEGGASGYGVVFAINASGRERVLHSFDYSDGCCTLAGLTKHGSALYGTTVNGGTHGVGVVFSVTKK
jgi:uncharacterized repeat protein (TIGR03803 family)